MKQTVDNVSKTWQLQDAKNQFSRVVNNAVEQGPQIVTKRGKEVVVVLAYDEYCELKGPQQSVWEFFRNSPLVGAGLDLSRDQSMGREVDL